ncbi:hypothetical protein [uncultured Bacteroides sp.]|uniref:hypothetical protein n=1 Tax=uncultured Bacteroides sp. TaxID=162156 RepID=UPI0025EE9833|nr:hypothetical protein [uncultured Bacteroides sp.]
MCDIGGNGTFTFISTIRNVLISYDINTRLGKLTWDICSMCEFIRLLHESVAIRERVSVTIVSWAELIFRKTCLSDGFIVSSLRMDVPATNRVLLGIY